jgi:succinate dehydrogenase / fumarate reductase, cytochrome b subunit
MAGVSERRTPAGSLPVSEGEHGMAEAEVTGKAGKPRPLSPHLQVYSPLINMVMSIFHRITGAALYFGTLILAFWLIAAASGAAQFDYVSALLASPFGLFVLFGYTWALVHHALGGLRHFIWDTGRGFDLGTVDALSWATIILSVLITVAIWAFVLLQRGILERIM